MIILIGERGNGPEERAPAGVALEDPLWRMTEGAFREGATRQRLIDCGLMWHAAANLLPTHPGEPGWDPRQAAVAAMALGQWAVDHEAILVVCGRMARAAFGLKMLGELLQVQNVVTFPHPSGRNRWWNEPESWQRARETARRVTEEHGS